MSSGLYCASGERVGGAGCGCDDLTRLCTAGQYCLDWEAVPWCADECLAYPLYNTSVATCGCSYNSTDTTCHQEMCRDGECIPQPEDCKDMQIAQNGTECLCPMDIGQKVCQEGEYCSLLDAECLNTTVGQACPGYPGITDQMCNCEDGFMCRPGYMCDQGQCLERPDPCPAPPYIYTGWGECWCDTAGGNCTEGQMCNNVTAECGAPPPSCPMAPLAPEADSTCVCSWPEERMEVAKVRHLLTGVLVGRWNGSILTPEVEGGLELRLDGDQRTLLNGTEVFGFLNNMRIHEGNPANGSREVLEIQGSWGPRPGDHRIECSPGFFCDREGQICTVQPESCPAMPAPTTKDCLCPAVVEKCLDCRTSTDLRPTAELSTEEESADNCVDTDSTTFCTSKDNDEFPYLKLSFDDLMTVKQVVVWHNTDNYQRAQNLKVWVLPDDSAVTAGTLVDESDEFLLGSYLGPPGKEEEHIIFGNPCQQGIQGSVVVIQRNTLGWSDKCPECLILDLAEVSVKHNVTDSSCSSVSTVALRRMTSSDGCPEGYTLRHGDVSGLGNAADLTSNKDIMQCKNLCDKNPRCCSFEWSPTKRKCIQNKQCNPTGGSYQDYFFCAKKGNGYYLSFHTFSRRLLFPLLLLSNTK